MFEKTTRLLAIIAVLWFASMVGTTIPVPAAPPVLVATTKTSIDISPTSVNHRIAFASDREHPAYYDIYTMNSDGSDVKRLTKNWSVNKTPAWSPDGNYIAFTSDRDGNNEIYVMDVNGNNLTRVTNDPAFDWEPAWSPDGRFIAFTSNRDGNWEIYLTFAPHVAAAVGENMFIRLTNSPAYDWQPNWSPDGHTIAFTSDRDNRWQLYTMHIDGSNLKRLTNTVGENRDPAWSPAGDRLAFVSTRDRAWEIYVMRADGSDARRLTFTTTINQSPNWSPDGRHIIFESNSEIVTMQVDGTLTVNLTNHPAVDFHPACACRFLQ